jgi:hypothetical protein
MKIKRILFYFFKKMLDKPEVGKLTDECHEARQLA